MCGYSIPWGKNWARSGRHSSLLQSLKDCERWEEKENSDPLNSFIFFHLKAKTPTGCILAPFGMKNSSKGVWE